jgi:hypothetical protein
LSQITVSLSDELPVGDDTSNDATIYNSNINEDEENLIYMGKILGRVGFYAGKINEDDGDIDECCYAGDKPDFIILGGFTNNDDKKEFVGRVITNWCDKYPTNSLVYGDKSVWDDGGIAEEENGNDLWISTSNDFPNLLSEIETLYEYLEIDSDDEEHYNLCEEIPDELRLNNLFEGEVINLKNVKKGNGFKLDLEIYLQNFKN